MCLPQSCNLEFHRPRPQCMLVAYYCTLGTVCALCYYYPGQKNWHNRAHATQARDLSSMHAPMFGLSGCLNFFGQGSSTWLCCGLKLWSDLQSFNDIAKYSLFTEQSQNLKKKRLQELLCWFGCSPDWVMLTFETPTPVWCHPGEGSAVWLKRRTIKSTVKEEIFVGNLIS